MSCFDSHIAECVLTRVVSRPNPLLGFVCVATPHLVSSCPVPTSKASPPCHALPCRRVSDYAYDQLPHLLPPPAPPSPPPIPPADSSTVGGLQHPQQQPAQPPNPPHSASQGGASQPSQQWVICKDDLTRIPLLEQVFRCGPHRHNPACPH